MEKGAISQEYEKKPHKPQVQSLKNTRLADYIWKQHDLSEHHKLQIVEDAWLGVSFFTGNQWVRFNRSLNKLVAENRPMWRVRMVLNYILPTVETFVGKVTENRPGFMCMPASTDDDDVEAARQCDRLLEWIWDELDMGLKINELAKWCALAPAAFLKVWWDPTKGAERMVSKALPGAEPDEEGFVPQKIETERTGMPHVDVLSVLEVGWDPGAKDIENCRWMLHTNYMHIDELRERWPKKGKQVDPGATMNMDRYSQLVIKQVRGNFTPEGATADRVGVVEYFEMPSPRYPKGLHAIVCRDVVLEEGDLPLGQLPFSVVRHNTIPGRFVGEGLVKPIIPPQKELNKCVSQRIENKNLHAMPKYRAEKGSVEKGSITDEPGEIIFYNKQATRPPEQLPPPPMSPEHRLIEAEQRAHIESISGIADISRGMAPAGISGRAIGLLADLDQTKLGPTVREFEKAIERAAAMMLRLWRENMDHETTVQVTGRTNEIEVFTFFTKQIKTTDVRVKANSMLPRHPSYRREQVLQMFQLGVLGDPADPQTKMRCRKMLEFGDLDEVHGDRNKDRNYAKEENHVMAEGNKLEPEPWEEHVVHIDQHLSFMKGIEYRMLPKEIQSLYEQHVAWHYYLESQNQQGQPWWHVNVAAGEPGWPPVPQQEPMQGAPEQPPPAPPVDAFGPEPGAPPMPMGGEELPPLPPGMGGTPELNQAIGTRGPGVPEFEGGFEM